MNAQPAKILNSELFDSLSKGQRVRVTFKAGMSAGSIELVAGRRSHSKKHGVDSLALDRADGRKVSVMNKFKLMRWSNGNVVLALGDMGCTVTAFEVLS